VILEEKNSRGKNPTKWPENYVDREKGNTTPKKTLGTLGLLKWKTSLRKDVINIEIFKITVKTKRETKPISKGERAFKK